MIKKKRIAVFTGKRGGSGALTKIMNGIKKSPYLEMKLIISDMHLSTRFGKTENEIKDLGKNLEVVIICDTANLKLIPFYSVLLENFISKNFLKTNILLNGIQ